MNNFQAFVNGNRSPQNVPANSRPTSPAAKKGVFARSYPRGCGGGGGGDGRGDTWRRIDRTDLLFGSKVIASRNVSNQPRISSGVQAGDDDRVRGFFE